MIKDDKNRVRLTRDELNTLRTANARNGNVVNDVSTTDELMSAAIGAQRPSIQSDLLEFLETGSSPLTRR
ncbi:MAG: hypothetical protein ACR2RB_01345 [Gammaproteobacteria bacterium]